MKFMFNRYTISITLINEKITGKYSQFDIKIVKKPHTKDKLLTRSQLKAKTKSIILTGYKINPEIEDTRYKRERTSIKYLMGIISECIDHGNSDYFEISDMVMQILSSNDIKVIRESVSDKRFINSESDNNIKNFYPTIKA